ncbi:MAG TPA: beta-ketoacyl-[acyl-carrier-protein] synthase family protein [Alphaproteobacteria bacterium]|nr:beta-ketoacyl-[acyl-carrier-protein] synthase family protein [Alphaproteobacteria bacterium]
MEPLNISAASLVCAMGRGLDEVAAAMHAEQSGLRPNDLPWLDVGTHIGRVEGLEDLAFPAALSNYDCRNNRLAQMGLETDGFSEHIAAARARYGAHRIAVVLGTSTSGIRQTEAAYEARDGVTGALPADFHLKETHDYFSLADFVRLALQLTGAAAVVSTACSSSSRAFIDATRLIEAGFCDAAVVGGVDTLCRLTARGFGALELLDAQPCRPNDRSRAGISIGEAAGFVLLERPGNPGPSNRPYLRLLGFGESSDGYHMSAPNPDGTGAQIAMREALRRSHLTADQIDYVNLHGTGTPLNDRAEDAAVFAVLGPGVPASSTKGGTGHTLGAAGITGILLAGLAIRHAIKPRNLNLAEVDPDFRSHILTSTQTGPVRHVLANAFGFGGSNCSIVLGAAS